MYPPPPPPLRMANIDPHSLYFSCIYPKFDRQCGYSMHAHVFPITGSAYEYLLKYADLHLEYFWRTSCYMYPPCTPECSILTRIPYILPVFTPKSDRLLWLNNACPCLPIYRVGRYGYVAYTQKIWSS